MPEEINRCIIGVLASLHCAPTRRAADSLAAEGVPAARIALTGNTIAEATLAMLPGEAAAREIAAAAGAEPDRYVLATIHRPENTDDPRRLGTILDELAQPGLHVHDRHAAVVPGLRSGHGRAGVPLDHHGRRALPREQLAELLGDPPDLSEPRLAADTGQHVRGGQAGPGQEHSGQLGVGVLAGMDELSLRPQNAYDMRELDYFWARSYDYGDRR